MTGLRRFPIIAIAALLAAGCGATPSRPAASEAGLVSPAAPPTSTASTASPAPALPSFAPSSTSPSASPVPGPDHGCAPLGDVDLTDLAVDLSSMYPNGNGGYGGFSIGLVNGALEVTRIDELSGRRQSAIPPRRNVQNGHGLMLGGHSFVTFPSTWFGASKGKKSVIQATVTLTLEGAAPIPLRTEVVPGNRNFDQVEVTVPDVAGEGQVDLAFRWADACYRYEASGTIPVEVVPIGQTAGCELDERNYWDQLRDLLTDAISIGGTTPRVVSAFNASKYAPYVNPGIDAWIGYMFDKKAPDVTAASRGTLVVENRKRQIELARRMEVVIWTRRSIASAVTDYPPKPTVEVFDGRIERQVDGSYVLPIPDVPGRYVAGLSVEFESRCSTGTLWSVVNLEVL